MTKINEQFRYFCGPYKGYYGKAEYDEDAETFHGEVIGTRDVITFEAEAPGGLRPAFMESVDDYLEFCASKKESPEKPFSGKFVTRISPEVHRKISVLAEQAGKSLNQFVGEYLASIAESTPAPPIGPDPSDRSGRMTRPKSRRGAQRRESQYAGESLTGDRKKSARRADKKARKKDGRKTELA